LVWDIKQPYARRYIPLQKGLKIKISADAVTPWVVGEIAWFCEQVAKAEADNLDDKKVSLRIFVCGQYKIFQKLLAFALSPPGQHPGH
jgi:hypothetical protein